LGSLESGNPGGKETKIPVNPSTGGNAQSDRPETWGTFQETLGFLSERKGNGIKGIGFVCSQNDDFCGIDLDKCRNSETGEIEPWAKEIVSELNSYSEITPSGCGLRVWIKGKLPAGGKRKGKIEFYDNRRFFTLTGQHLRGTPDT
jgi:putative DNA primase/helicase